MAKKDPRVDAYIDKSAKFAKPILRYLRKVVHAGCPQSEETIKWQMPHFDYKGPLCGMAAFKEHCAFGFWKGPLILGRSQGGEGMGHFGRITSLADLPDEKTLIGYVRKAAKLNDDGVQVPGRGKARKRPPLKVPAYFLDALKKNAKAKKNFENFSPSRQREYVEWVTQAKREETRARRLKTSVAWLAEGKPQNWKYLPARK
ncbi:MAG: hypothetical protein QOI04_219 [Verrucomicrobiota bacterium]|jgi:uncharacterized protein YdeI (YjbR/CyaY-like superfamily)